MKKAALLLPLLVLLAACESTQSGLKPLSQIAPSVAAEGTLANAKLLADASEALYAALKVAPDERGQTKILKFVIQQPVGPVGKKAWREMWIFMRGGESISFIVTFTEDGTGSADFLFQQHG